MALVISFVFSWFCVSCDDLEQNSKDKTSIQNEVVFHPDIKINNSLALNDYTSFEKFNKNNNGHKFVEFIRSSPVIVFCNEAKTEYLLAYQYEGGVKNSFSLFEIGYTGEIDCENKTTYESFSTESGVRLGLTMDELIKIKGDSYTQINQSVIYKIEDYENSDFLKEYNMPMYYLKCRFEKGKIDQIMLGFDYP